MGAGSVWNLCMGRRIAPVALPLLGAAVQQQTLGRCNKRPAKGISTLFPGWPLAALIN